MLIVSLALGWALGGGVAERPLDQFLADLQAATVRNDRSAIAGMVHYPIKVLASGWIIPIDDRATYALLQRGETKGIFQLESGGIRDLLLTLSEAGIPAAVASSAPARWVVGAVERIGLRPLFGAIVTGDEVAHRKPAPDVYLEAARRLGVDPVRSVAIEDSGPGISAARAAGMKAVAIPHWLTERHDLSGADLTVAHAGELTLDRLASLYR